MKAAIYIVSGLLYLASLLLPALYTGKNNQPWYGYLLFLIGPLGALGLIFAWYSHLFLVAAIIFFQRNSFMMAVVLAGVAVLVSCTVFFTSQIPVSSQPRYESINQLGPGFWCWLAAQAVLLLGSLYLYSATEV